jgi:organic radical activating enzyme
MANVVDQWNVSPKLASSGNTERARHRPNALAWFASQSHATFKIVQASDADLEETEALVIALGVPRSRVVLMPEGTEPTALAERSRALADTCRKHGYRLGTRLHVFLWGQERGR